MIGHAPWNKGLKIQTNTGRTHFKKGYIPWMKGKKGVFKHTEQWKIDNGLRMIGNTQGFKKGNIPWNKGTSNKWYWDSVKKSKEWKEMRKVVFERDDYTCQICGQKGGVLHPDHIKPKIAFPELVFELSNVRTLCRECHRKTDTYGYKAKQIKDKLQIK